MPTNLNVTKEVEFIGPGFRRSDTSSSFDGTIRRGYWTPELARWTDESGYQQKYSLVEYRYESGLKIIGAKANACPVICVLESSIAERDLEIRVTGSTALPSGIITSGGTGISGFALNHQYGTDIYRREWVTGGSTFNYSFTIDKHELPGKTYLMPNKRIYEITNIDVRISGSILPGQRQEQPLTDIRFYALADNGSKLLYSFNWDRLYADLRKMMFSNNVAPKVCATCNGSGSVGGGNCLQCDGYGYSGWNSTGYMFREKAKEYGIINETGMSFAEYQDKVWAMSWELSPTKKEIQRYFAHFAQIEDESVEVINNFRTTSTSGIESIVTIQIPYNLPESRFSTNDAIWEVMCDHCEPAGVDIYFSFVVSGQLTGQIDFEDLVSPYRDYYSGAELYTGGTGTVFTTGFTYGFDYPFGLLTPPRASSWRSQWGNPFATYCFASGHISGDDAVSGGSLEMWDLAVAALDADNEKISFAGDYSSHPILGIKIYGSTDVPDGYYTVSNITWNDPNTDFTVNEDVVGSTVDGSGLLFAWKSGLLEGDQWLRCRQPTGTLVNDVLWNTGGSDLVNQGYLWTSGTYIFDNFWGSGADGNIYY